MKTRTKSIIMLVVGVVLLVLGILFLTLFKNIIKDEVHKQVILKQGTAVFEGWRDTPFPILFKFWFFNCTNCIDEYEAGDFVPNLEEVGPYTLEMKWEKINFHEYDDKMKYYSYRTFSFREDLSGTGLLYNDTVVMPNVIALVVLYIADLISHDQTYSFPKFDCGIKCIAAVNKWLENCTDDIQPYTDMNIGDFLTDGVKSECILQPLHDQNEAIPETFSLFGEANVPSLEGEYVVYTGEDDTRKRSFIYTFDGDSTNGNAWEPGSVCNDIVGTDGQLWIPFATKEDKVSVWSSDIKRSLPFRYDKTVRVKGAEGYSYAIMENAYDNSTLNSENECYEHGEERPSGVYHYGNHIPLAFSHPHYLYADPFWTQNISGMNASRTLHESKFVVEPVTGVPLEVQISLQANFHVHRVTDSTELPGPLKGWKNLTDYYHPLLWFTTYSLVDQGTADDVVLLTETLEVILNAIGGCLVAIGGALLLAVPVLVYFKWKK